MKSFRIAVPVRKEIEAQDKNNPKPIPVIIAVRESKQPPGLGVGPSKQRVREYLESKNYHVDESDFYVFARLLPADIEGLASQTDWVYQIWKDETCHAHLLTSLDTVKATACWRTFDGRGKGITWAVLDTGIKSDHPHLNGTVDLSLSCNFSNAPSLEDQNGHGTHVAGIIAGCGTPRPSGAAYKAATLVEGQDEPEIVDLTGCPAGVAPFARLINVKVLDDDGSGAASAAIRGLEYVRKLNQNSRSIIVDGVNLSLGYPFDPKWYGCGHSPLCDEVTRAVGAGLVVVISCGNSGYGTTRLDTGEEVPTWIDLSISDPANTDDAIAVGSVLL